MKLPTRDQARRIASDKCEDGNRCDECDISGWCGSDLEHTMRLGQVVVALYDEIEKRDSLIRRMAEAIRENWEDMWRNIGIEELYAEAESILGPTRNPHVGFGTIEIQPFPEPLQCKTDMEGEWIDEAGTHDGGTVPEGDRSSTGPASAREDEYEPE